MCAVANAVLEEWRKMEEFSRRACLASRHPTTLRLWQAVAALDKAKREKEI